MEGLEWLNFFHDTVNRFRSHHGFIVFDLSDPLFFHGLAPIENFFFSVPANHLFTSLTLSRFNDMESMPASARNTVKWGIIL
jgi:hypothetical protein